MKKRQVAWTNIEEWPHGRVWKGKNGRMGFYIQRDRDAHATSRRGTRAFCAGATGRVAGAR